MASGASTPKTKRRKTTWSALLRTVDAELIPEGVCLETLLSDACEAEIFIQTSEFVQRATLQAVFEGQDELIKSVAIKQNTGKKLTDVDQVTHFVWPPSSRLEPDSFIEVLRAIFQESIATEIASERDIYNCMFVEPNTSTSQATPPSPTSQATQQPPILKLLQSEFLANMTRLHEKEACGVPLLGAFVTHLAGELTRTTSGNVFFSSDMEFPVVKHKLKPGACDGAIRAVVHVRVQRKENPILLFEYKPVVDPRLQSVERHHLMELLIQGYYCLHQHTVPTLIHCLTDLSQWYYFKLDKATPCKLKVAWYRSIHESLYITT